jgi:hypothetical protein
LVAGKLRCDLHSPFCDSIHGLYLQVRSFG